jgi:hypothetical protein
MTVPPLPDMPEHLRTRRIVRDGSEVRQVLQHLVDGIVWNNQRTAAALIADGFDESEVNKMILTWWKTEGLECLKKAAAQFEHDMAEVDAERDQEAQD